MKTTKDRKRRELKAQLRQTYSSILDTRNIHKQADYRLKALRLQKLLERLDNPVDRREYVTDKHVAGYCMNCDIPVSAYSDLKVVDNGSMFCCDGCRVHYDELCGHKKTAASRERNRLTNIFEKTINVILSNNELQGKLG